MESTNRKRVVILARASSGKQIIKGDTLDDQIEQCTDYEQKQEWQIVKIFPLVESGTIKERIYFQEVLDYCKNPQNRVNYILFKNISRFTRGGDVEYLKLKEGLEKAGVEIRDIYGTIQPKVNTMERFGLKYEWSTYSPSQTEETYQSNKAKDYVRDALTQMIGAEVIYTNKGYWCRGSPYGFVIEKIVTAEDGERKILKEHVKEGFFIKKMYEMLDTGHSYKETTSRTNMLGFKTRKFYKHDKKTKKVIGTCGEEPLTVKHLQELVRKPIYAGIICEKWTHNQPVKAKFDGLIDIDVFNRVNTGKVKIIKLQDGTYQIKYGKDLKDSQNIIRRLKDNPLYPYKGIILCPVCRGTIKGSASRGKSGKKFPAYHCSTNHKLWRIPRAKFHQIVYDFIRTIRFNLKLSPLSRPIFAQTKMIFSPPLKY